MIDWTKIWLQMFDSTTWLGIDIGFWVSMAVCAIVVVLMNIMFWRLTPVKTIKVSDYTKIKTVGK